tara:strand:+ start:240 stop:635 length:396 start_codon:yes stop_codon:yes gene_type:complete
MQLTNSASFRNSTIATNNVVTGTAKAKTSSEPLSKDIADKASKPEQNLNNQKESNQNVELNEAAIAFLESKQAQGDLVQQADEFSVNSSDEEFAKETISSQNQTAVSSYQAIGNLAQRESVQQLLGIDLYA